MISKWTPGMPGITKPGQGQAKAKTHVGPSGRIESTDVWAVYHFRLFVRAVRTSGQVGADEPMSHLLVISPAQHPRSGHRGGSGYSALLSATLRRFCCGPTHRLHFLEVLLHVVVFLLKRPCLLDHVEVGSGVRTARQDKVSRTSRRSMGEASAPDSRIVRCRLAAPRLCSCPVLRSRWVTWTPIRAPRQDRLSRARSTCHSRSTRRERGGTVTSSTP